MCCSKSFLGTFKSLSENCKIQHTAFLPRAPSYRMQVFGLRRQGMRCKAASLLSLVPVAFPGEGKQKQARDFCCLYPSSSAAQRRCPGYRGLAQGSPGGAPVGAAFFHRCGCLRSARTSTSWSLLPAICWHFCFSADADCSLVNSIAFYFHFACKR